MLNMCQAGTVLDSEFAKMVPTSTISSNSTAYEDAAAAAAAAEKDEDNDG